MGSIAFFVLRFSFYLASHHEMYRCRFFERVSADRFVELNFKQKLMGFVDIGAPRTVFIELKHLVFLEDRSRIGKGNGAANPSIILAIAMNILRLHGYFSITSAQRFISNDIDKLLLLVG